MNNNNITKLINKINKMSSIKFIHWYQNQIQYYTSHSSLVCKVISDSTTDKYFILFSHLITFFNNKFETISEYGQLLEIIASNSFIEFYVSECKKELIQKINTLLP